MFTGYLSLGGAEIANSARTLAYTARHLPGLDLRGCDACDGMHNALNSPPYASPEFDTAPWYEITDPDTIDFYGLYVTSVDGLEDSSATLTVTELIGDGAVHSQSRHGGKEVRVRGILVARTRAGMNAGMRYLKSTTDGIPCGAGVDCLERTLQWFTECPGAVTSAIAAGLVSQYRRTSYRVKMLDGLSVVREHPVRNGFVTEVEFTLAVGVPWSFTDLVPTVTSTGLPTSTVAEVTCSPQSAYDDLLLDPSGPVLPQPPVPPAVSVIDMPTSWSRRTAVIPESKVRRWGRLAEVIEVNTGGSALRNLRIRFYLDDNGLPGLDYPECDYEGEFLVTYVPANSSMRIHGILRTIEVLTPSGVKPAGHLVMGSDGRPPTWPTLGCIRPYLVVMDAASGLGSANVVISIALGE